MLEVRDLAAWFSGVRAVDGVDLTIPTGQIRAVIGPNGAGKTTFFNLVTGFLPKTRGRVWLDGADITKARPERLVREGLGRTFQVPSIFPGLSVLDNVRLGALLRQGLTPSLLRQHEHEHATRREGEAILARVGLLDQAGTMAGTLSHGDAKRLDLAVALATRPKLLLLDEPTAGMSEVDTRAMVELLRDIARDLTMVFTEHDMRVVFSIAQQITVLHQGRVIADGAPEVIGRDPEVRSAYLGEEALA